MSTKAGTTRHNPYGRAFAGLQAGGRGYSRLKTVGEMGALGVTTSRMALLPPFPWLREASVQLSLAFRRCSLPLLLSHGIYVVGFGMILFGAILNNLGLPERESGIIFIIWSREIATWITGMIFAGVVGSAVTADLGARKIRDELDALSVLGVEQVRTLVVPRVVAMTLAMPALALLSLLWVNMVNFVLAPSYFGFSNAVFLDNLSSTIQLDDVYFTVLLKNLILGFFVGIVSCYKGLSSPGGAEGVGRAVSQTVVITFFGIWLFSTFFNIAYYTLLPDVSIPRG